MAVTPGPFTGDMKSNSSSFISNVFGAFSKSAGKTRSPHRGAGEGGTP